VSPTALATATPVRPSSEGWIAFFNRDNIWLIHPDGTGLKQITDNAPAAGDGPAYFHDVRWSPDGQKLAFSVDSRLSDNGLYVVDVGTFTTSVLVDDTEGGFDWSLTSKQIIYDDSIKNGPGPGSFHYYNSGLWFVNVETGKTRRIVESTPDFPTIISPRWSPEGSHVLVADPGSVEPGGEHVIDIATGKITTILSGGTGVGTGNCKWSPTELMIACTRNSELPGHPLAVHFLNANGASIRDINLPPELASPFLGPWSPDGKKLGLGYQSGTYDANNLQDLTAILSLDSGEFELVGPGIPASWSPDGEWIATSVRSRPPDQLTRTMMLINARTRETIPLSKGSYPLWQPSGAATQP
jgi:Tol biopolymer transport system component